MLFGVLITEFTRMYPQCVMLTNTSNSIFMKEICTGKSDVLSVIYHINYLFLAWLSENKSLKHEYPSTKL